MVDVRILEGDCLDLISDLADGSIDAVVSDPPYAEVDREYGRLSEADWHVMMDRLITGLRPKLKPKGSMIFILQPNFEEIGKMRTWLMEFTLRWAKAWNLVQDVYWWNFTALPNAGSMPKSGLMRGSLKPMPWFGDPDCYRDQDEILWDESEGNAADRASVRFARGRTQESASGNTVNARRVRNAALSRGGVTPFNVWPIPGACVGATGKDSQQGQPAATPMPLADKLVRYLCPPGGTVLDPFAGSGTIPFAAYRSGRNAIAMERFAKYHPILYRRWEAEQQATPLFAEVCDVE